MPGNPPTQKKITQIKSQHQSNTHTVNSKICAGMDYKFEGEDRSELNLFMQHGLVAMGYDRNSANRICKFVVAHCNDERILNAKTKQQVNNGLFKLYSDETVVSHIYKTVQSLIVDLPGK